MNRQIICIHVATRRSINRPTEFSCTIVAVCTSDRNDFNRQWQVWSYHNRLSVNRLDLSLRTFKIGPGKRIDCATDVSVYVFYMRFLNNAHWWLLTLKRACCSKKSTPQLSLHLQSDIKINLEERSRNVRNNPFMIFIKWHASVK